MMVVENSSLSMNLVEQIRERIITGKYASGDNLHEAKLCEEYGVSRTPIREALRRLELEGMINIIPNRGAVVKCISHEDIMDVYNIRMRIEGMTASLAAKKITKEQIEELRDSLELFEFYISKGNIEQSGELDMRFHEIIYKAAGSKLAWDILNNLHYFIKNSRKISLRVNGRAGEAQAEHKAIFEAIVAGDEQMADSLQQTHIRNAAAVYNKSVRGV